MTGPEIPARFDPGHPVVADVDPRGPLIVDEDGAPVAHELQRGGRIWGTVAWSLFGPGDLDEPERDVVDDVARKLAPVLWPLLPSNATSAAAAVARLAGTVDTAGPRIER